MNCARNFRHGDVIIVPCTQVEGKAIKTLVIAEGETTGHKHVIVAEREGDAMLYEKDGTLYLSAKANVKVTHEEHGTQTIPAGTYKITKQREYSPKGWKAVQD